MAYINGKSILFSPIINTTGNGNGETLNALIDGSLTSIDIAPGITTISTSRFAGLHNLKAVTIPDSVTKIEGYAFQNCNALESITIPDSVNNLGTYCFLACTGLKQITLSKSITSLISGTFQGCSSLQSITIPDNITGIYGNALRIGSETAKATITMESTNPPTLIATALFADFLEKIIVPAGCGAKYKAATNWATFADYIEEATE